MQCHSMPQLVKHEELSVQANFEDEQQKQRWHYNIEDEDLRCIGEIKALHQKCY